MAFAWCMFISHAHNTITTDNKLKIQKKYVFVFVWGDMCLRILPGRFYQTIYFLRCTDFRHHVCIAHQPMLNGLYHMLVSVYPSTPKTMLFELKLLILRYMDLWRNIYWATLIKSTTWYNWVCCLAIKQSRWLSLILNVNIPIIVITMYYYRILHFKENLFLCLHR